MDRRCRGRVVRAAAALALVVAAAACSDDGGGPPARTGSPATAAPTSTTPAKADSGVGQVVVQISGPVEGGTYGVPFNPLPPTLADEYGYEEAEYLMAGDATAYGSSAPLTADGRWTVAATTVQPYTTRLLVRRPVDPAAFNGTVMVEWLNVTSGMDSDAFFGQARVELLRRGYAWVGVSAQSAGVMGGGARIPIEGVDVRALREWDPVRYATLAHPGDDYSYDIFTQAASVVRGHGSVDVLRGLRPRALLAAGESQSAFRLVTYIDALHPVVHAFDGYLVHSRGGGAAALNGEAAGSPPSGTRIRDDLDVPVLVLQTETDVLRLGSIAARQPDTSLVRTWEVAGTAHADRVTLDYGLQSGAVWNPAGAVDLGALCGAINDGPLTYAARAAIRALDGWVRDGTPPASAPPITVVDGAIARDVAGNALGGVRLPAVEAPVESLSGESPPDRSVLCSLFGAATPLPPDERATVEDVAAAAQRAVAAGFLLAEDVDEIVTSARRA